VSSNNSVVEIPPTTVDPIAKSNAQNKNKKQAQYDAH
jgi:hypothetical protein